MPFDPTKPAANTPNSSTEMRGQLNALNDRIDAVPVVDTAVVLTTNTLPPGSAATAEVNVNGDTLELSFGIPEGAQGQEGPQGIEGPQGPPFANAVVDGVSTLSPGDPATVTVGYDGSNVHFTFGIPQGAPGLPGEVTQVDLANAIGGTSNNSNAVNTLGMVVSDPPTQAEVQAIADKLDELINALRR